MTYSFYRSSMLQSAQPSLDCRVSLVVIYSVVDNKCSVCEQQSGGWMDGWMDIALEYIPLYFILHTTYLLSNFTTQVAPRTQRTYARLAPDTHRNTSHIYMHTRILTQHRRTHKHTYTYQLGDDVCLLALHFFFLLLFYFLLIPIVSDRK